MMLPYASSSSTTVSPCYNVFLSFRGEDTRNNFIGHLYDALTRNDITTFKDDKTLEIGNHIASELLEAIDTSRIAIVVLSANFATSKWCLKELAKIADCMKRKKLTAIPIFYHVSPSDVRSQSNSFAQGFADHELDTEITQEKVETWRAAFQEVGLISGLHVTEHSVEADIIKEVVRKVLRCLRDTNPADVTNGLVGIESRVEQVKRKLQMNSNEVLFLGICGSSGIGKTTLAEVVYENIKDKFEKSCFIESIKNISKQNNSSDLRKFQQTILNDILKEESVCVQTVKNGQNLLSTRLRGFKVIIVLDDVNNVDQLTYLAGTPEWFGPGSRIIITTRKVELLNAHKVNDIYRCENMEGDEALSLFCLSAFEQSHPTHGYEDMSNCFVNLAGGLPSALNAYGKLLYGKDKNFWNETLRMKTDGGGRGNNKNQRRKGGNNNNNDNNQQQQDMKMPSFRGGGSGGDGSGKNVPKPVKFVEKDDGSDDDDDDDDEFDDDDDDEYDDEFDDDDDDDGPVKEPVIVGNQGQTANMSPQLMKSGQIPPQLLKGGQQMKPDAPPMVNKGGNGNGGKKGDVGGGCNKIGGGGGNVNINNGHGDKKGGMPNIKNGNGVGANPGLMGNMKAVQGLPPKPTINGGCGGGNFRSGGLEAMAGPTMNQRQAQLVPTSMMNQQHANGGERFHPMMHSWPCPLNHYPHPPKHYSFIHCFNVESTSCCSIL